ncbi:hypothetical protein GCM10010833_11670 [Blastomonas aquatica]|uniref:Uncharacterized protein n=2 Tax=Blastomonas aquatica TaxID=1510276 RepID=A0ABQ1J4N7_9SPHN|nr:hypothetical protein [Blastomonas aquatica]GGB58573.1 hypothetical protein GCM10010833_11670 [Blastomonas aquatica]
MFAFALLVALAGPALQLHAQTLSFRSTDHASGSGRHVRLQADLARRVESWQASRTCASARLARSALKPAVAQWLGTQMMANPGKTLTQWGYHSGDIWVENHMVDGVQRCRAGFRKLIAFAEFG